MTIFILKLLAIWLASSIALGLIVGPIMHWGLHYEPPVDMPPLNPMPSGSMSDRVSP